LAGTIFLAGASGVIGRAMLPRLVADGWAVVGTTRRAAKAEELRAAGITPVVVDVFDAAALAEALARTRPDIVVHQLTDLPRSTSPGELDAIRARNARLRDEGTRNLITAALAAGAKRFIAQSISFAYAPGQQPYSEDAPLNDRAEGTAGVTARGVASLERQVLEAPLHGIVLRYGRLYGPGTGTDSAPKLGPLHVEEAANAACLALTAGSPGIYNIAEADGYVDVGKAKRELGWPG
jgi:nucleoside-diphosphate-sugar epimerase